MGFVVPFPHRLARIKASLLAMFADVKMDALHDHSNKPRAKRKLSSWWMFWFKGSQALVLAIAVYFSLGATDAASRFNDLSHRLMCTCGCAQLLGECNHVGCPESGRERQELSANIAAGLSDQEILNWFANKYGTTMLAAPPAKGFNLVAWIAPFAVFLAALAGTILLIRRWGGLKGGKVDAGAAAAELAALDPAERERRAQIRRDVEGEL